MRKGNVVQNKFFALLIDYEILRSSESKAGNEVLVVGDELEQSRDLIDLKDRLEDSSSFFRSYLIVQVPACLPKIYQSANVSEIHFSYFFAPTFQIVETVFSLACFGFLGWKLASNTVSFSDPNMYCDVHGRMYECTGHPSAFYEIVIFVTCGMFFLYGLISFYSVLWSVCPCMQTLKQVVELGQGRVVDKDEEIKLSPDFLFLLNLLVLGSGIAPAITAMTVLEPVRLIFTS